MPVPADLLTEALKALLPVFNQLAGAIEAALPIVGDIAMAFGVMAGPLLKLTPLLIAVTAALHPLEAIGNLLGKAFSALAGTVKTALGVLASLASAFKSAVLEPLMHAVGSLVNSFLSALRQFLAASFTMAGTTDALKRMSGALTAFISGVTGGVQSLVQAVTPFVQALNPNIIFVLNYAMRSLYATIGVALLPVVRVLASGIRQMAGALLPAMQALAPILGKLASIIMGFVVNSVQRFAQNLIDMAPILNMLADVAGVLVGAWEAVRAVVFAFIDSLVNWIRGILGGGESADMLKVFRDALHRVVEALTRFSVMLARFLGFSDFVSNLKNQLTKFAEPVKASGAPPAPQEVGFKTFEDISRTMASAAFAAQGGAGNEAEAHSEREWLKHLADSLDAMKDEGPSLKEFLAEKLSELSDKAEEAGAQFLDNALAKLNEYKKDIMEELQTDANKIVEGVIQNLGDKYGKPAMQAVGGFAAGLAEVIPGSHIARAFLGG